MRINLKKFMFLFLGVFIPLSGVFYITYVINSGQTFDPTSLFAKQPQLLDNT